MADTTNATCYGGIDVPHWNLSAAKIDIIPEISKFFRRKFSMGIKITEAGHENLLPLCIELLQKLITYYNKYPQNVNWSA